jgi:hypothetical protein
MVDGGFGRVEVTGKVSRTIRLSNFFAWISEQVSRDDGITRTTCYRIEGILWDGTPLHAEIAQQDFKAMRWVEAQFGLDAMIYPGKSGAQHVYSAIKFFSHDRKSRTVYFLHFPGSWVARQSPGGATWSFPMRRLSPHAVVG